MCSSENFTTLGFDGFSLADPFGQITYAPNTVLPVVIVAQTQREFNGIFTGEKNITSTLGMMETTGNDFRGMSLLENQSRIVTFWTDASSHDWRANLNDFQIPGS